jgi:hypothetical protein
MAGKPGRSGGRRPGAGRPPQSWRLRNGDTCAAWETQDGKQVGIGRLATVLVVSRSVLVIRLDDGTEIKLVR